jgi:pimeloyl-ACP methyl ester carboxylesterase
MGDAKRVRVGELEIEYEDWGCGERPFLLVHGYTGSRCDFREVLPELAPLGRTLALDLRGHGGTRRVGETEGPRRGSSPAGDAPTLDDLALDLAGFLDALGIERCDLLGHSMGGAVVLRFALAQPGRIASLVLMDTSGSSFPVRRDVLEAAFDVVRSEGMGRLFEIARALAAVDPNRPPSLRRLEQRDPEGYWDWVRHKYEAMDPEAFVSLGRALSDPLPLLGRLGALRCPALVVVGQEDADFLEHARALEAALPAARHVVIPDAAHSPQLENREAWLAAVRAHLAEARSDGQ